MAHANRSRAATPFSNPDPETIRARRDAAGLTQKEAAHLVRGTERAWQNWEAGERSMHPGLWELFCLRVDELPAPLRTSTAGRA